MFYAETSSRKFKISCFCQLFSSAAHTLEDSLEDKLKGQPQGLLPSDYL